MSIFDLLDVEYNAPLGERKLTAADVADIRRLYAECGWKQQDIADHFGISQPQVSKIVNNLQWKA